jgi:hypothetical protein
MWPERQVGRVARMRLLPIGVLALLLTAGCLAPPDPLSPRAEGDRAVAAQADRIAHWLDNRPRAMHDSLDLARAVLGEPQWTGTEVLSATGDRRDGSAELLLRVTMQHVVDGSSTETRCHLLTQTGRYDSFTSKRRDCPAGAVALTPPPKAPEPSLPPGFADRLAAALRALPPAQRSDPAAVEAAARRLLGGNPAAVRTATAASGTVGLAVSAARYDCVLAAVDGSVSVWLPPRIYLEPGEGGCSADAAAARQLQRSPH